MPCSPVTPTHQRGAWLGATLLRPVAPECLRKLSLHPGLRAEVEGFGVLAVPEGRREAEDAQTQVATDSGSPITPGLEWAPAGASSEEQ